MSSEGARWINYRYTGYAIHLLKIMQTIFKISIKSRNMKNTRIVDCGKTRNCSASNSVLEMPDVTSSKSWMMDESLWFCMLWNISITKLNWLTKTNKPNQNKTKLKSILCHWWSFSSVQKRLYTLWDERICLFDVFDM